MAVCHLKKKIYLFYDDEKGSLVSAATNGTKDGNYCEKEANDYHPNGERGDVGKLKLANDIGVNLGCNAN